MQQQALAEFMSLLGGMQGGYSWDNIARQRYLSVVKFWQPKLLRIVGERMLAQSRQYRPSPEQLLVLAAETVFPCHTVQEVVNELRFLVNEYGLYGVKAEGFASFRQPGCPPIESTFIRKVVNALGGWESVVAVMGSNYDPTKKIEAVYTPIREQWNKSAVRKLNEKIQGAVA
jgi:hypothetical protein